jgi:hypothetical protein
MRRETMPEDPTSDDLNRLIAEGPDGGYWLAPRDDIEIILEVSVDPTTLSNLSDRATREGRDIGEVVADVLREAAA